MELFHRSPLRLLMNEFEAPFCQAAKETTSGDPQEVAAACLEKATEIFRQRIQADVIGELGYWNSQYRLHVLQEAQQWAANGAEAYYVEVDLRNVGGVNALLGHDGCNNTLFIPVARILRDCLKEALEISARPQQEQEQWLADLVGGGLEDDETQRIIQGLSVGWIEAFRHGGDEVSFVVVGIPERLLTTLLDKAYRLVAEHEQQEGLKFLPHPKHLLSFHLHWGISISYGIAKASPDLEPKTIFSAADRRVEEMKRCGRPSYGRGTGTTARSHRRYKLSDYPKLWFLALRSAIKG